jgi:hypothetical protein
VAQIEGENNYFAEVQDAVDYAGQAVTKLARQGAAAAGAVAPRVLLETTTEGHLQRIIARGIGNPKL